MSVEEKRIVVIEEPTKTDVSVKKPVHKALPKIAINSKRDFDLFIEIARRGFNESIQTDNKGRPYPDQK